MAQERAESRHLYGGGTAEARRRKRQEPSAARTFEIIRYADKQMDTLWPEYTRLLNPDLMEINLSDKLQTLKSELIRRELGE